MHFYSRPFSLCERMLVIPDTLDPETVSPQWATVIVFHISHHHMYSLFDGIQSLQLCVDSTHLGTSKPVSHFPAPHCQFPFHRGGAFHIYLFLKEVVYACRCWAHLMIPKLLEENL